MAQHVLSASSELLSRNEFVAAEIKRAILRGDLAPGERLVERDIASALGVSTTPVREALKGLSHTGLVTINGYRGTSVTQVDRELARQLYELRLLLEPEAVRQSVVRHDDATLAEARSALDDAAQAGSSGDAAELSLANRRFHKALYATCANALLRDTLDHLQDRVALVSVLGWRKSSSWDAEARQHEAILRSIVRKDAEAAEQRTRAHIQKFLDLVVSSLEDANAGTDGKPT